MTAHVCQSAQLPSIPEDSRFRRAQSIRITRWSRPDTALSPRAHRRWPLRRLDKVNLPPHIPSGLPLPGLLTRPAHRSHTPQRSSSANSSSSLSSPRMCQRSSKGPSTLCGRRSARRGSPACGEASGRASCIGVVSWRCLAVSGILLRGGRDVASSHANSFTGFEFFNRIFQGWEGTSWGMSKEMANFLAGGMASNLYWGMALRRLTTRRTLLLVQH